MQIFIVGRGLAPAANRIVGFVLFCVRANIVRPYSLRHFVTPPSKRGRLGRARRPRRAVDFNSASVDSHGRPRRVAPTNHYLLNILAADWCFVASDVVRGEENHPSAAKPLPPSLRKRAFDVDFFRFPVNIFYTFALKIHKIILYFFKLSDIIY